jgi:hypothetical protein
MNWQSFLAWKFEKWTKKLPLMNAERLSVLWHELGEVAAVGFQRQLVICYPPLSELLKTGLDDTRIAWD